MPQKRKRPTELELELLKVLWDQGPSTVRQVWDALSARRRVGYTTVLKMLQIMEEKGLARCDRSRRAHVYQAQAGRRATLTRIANDVLEQVFDGSMQQLLVHAFARKGPTRRELDELRKLLEMLEESERDERPDDAP